MLPRRKFVFWTLAALSLILLLYLKNLALFGFIGPSSWTGMTRFKMLQTAIGTNAVLVSKKRPAN